MLVNLSFLKPLVFLALEKGIPAQTLSVLLLFPLVVVLIAAARYLVGIKSLGIFTPGILAVVFLQTGLKFGLVFFFLVWGAVTAGRILTKGFHLHYLARMSLLIWGVSLAVFVSLFLLKISLFPLLILILLGENLVEVQISRGEKEAISLILETLILALVSWRILSWEGLQKAALSQPEIFVLGTAILNIFIGRFTGLRLLEYKRFRRLV